MNRREFMGAVAGAAVLQVGASGSATPAGGGTSRPSGEALPGRPLGRTGLSVSIVGLGGSHIGRSRLAAAQQIDESLRRLGTDHVDLLQFHEIIRPSDPERIFGPDGAIEAALAARRSGKARFLGFTGHKSPGIHLAMLKACEAHGFVPDTVQMPLNVLDASYDSFQAKVLPELVRRGIGVLGMKPLGDGFVLKSGAVSPEEALRYAMSVPGVAVTITGIDSSRILDQAVRIARGFQPLSDAGRRELEGRAAAVASDGRFEAYKSSHQFDSTHQHPEWLG